MPQLLVLYLRQIRYDADKRLNTLVRELIAHGVPVRAKCPRLLVVADGQTLLVTPIQCLVLHQLGLMRHPALLRVVACNHEIANGYLPSLGLKVQVHVLQNDVDGGKQQGNPNGERIDTEMLDVLDQMHRVHPPQHVRLEHDLREGLQLQLQQRPLTAKAFYVHVGHG